MIIVPEEAGLMRAPVSTLKGGGPEENAERLKMLLMGYAFPAEAHVVALNAGALLMTAGVADSLKEGAEHALQATDSGRGHKEHTAFTSEERPVREKRVSKW